MSPPTRSIPLCISHSQYHNHPQQHFSIKFARSNIFIHPHQPIHPTSYPNIHSRPIHKRVHSTFPQNQHILSPLIPTHVPLSSPPQNQHILSPLILSHVPVIREAIAAAHPTSNPPNASSHPRCGKYTAIPTAWGGGVVASFTISSICNQVQ